MQAFEMPCRQPLITLGIRSALLLSMKTTTYQVIDRDSNRVVGVFASMQAAKDCADAFDRGRMMIKAVTK
jgi:hypothetical protein